MQTLVGAITEHMLTRAYAKIHAALGRAIDHTPTGTDRNAFSYVALDVFNLMLAQENQGATWQGEPVSRLVVANCAERLQQIADAAPDDKINALREVMRFYVEVEQSLGQEQEQEPEDDVEMLT